MRYLFLKLLPKNLVSKALGKLADIELPSPFLSSLIKIYCQFYAVNLKEMKKSSLSSFKTFNEFFTRELKEGVRPVDQEESSVVSPVDGTVAEFGEIEDGLLLQTKGVYYSTADLVGVRNSEQFQGGYFITLYLSPSDYHRIHTPVAGKVREFSYFSGNLWPVNEFGVENIGGLFSLNERIVTSLESSAGMVGIVKVGATVVGKIKLDYSDLSSNSGENTQLHLPVFPAKTYGKGDEIGLFQLGSTVILLFQKDSFNPKDLFHGKKIKMGEVIGQF